MLTRLEVNGFKNLLDFECDLGPYTCIAGPNSAGKSNIFDAIHFLSLLSDRPLMEAAQLVRSAGTWGADPLSLFWSDGGSREEEMSFAVEMIVPDHVVDDFGRTAEPTTTFLRYSLSLGYESPNRKSPSQLGRLVLRSEELTHITLGAAKDHLPWPHSKQNFRDKVVTGRRSGTAYISTSVKNDETVVNVHQDGGSRGNPRPSPAARAPRTIVSTTTSSDEPTILAARREMQQWRILALEPAAMRTPDSAGGPTEIGSDGSHLASALFRLAADRGDDVYAEVASEAAALTDVRSLSVDLDRQRELLTLFVKVGSGPKLPARAISDGTLRFLALCVMRLDERFVGLLCMEEPENGIHPGKVGSMVDLIRDLAVDQSQRPDSDNPMRQLIVNTHSPYFVQLQDENDLLYALPRSVRVGERFATTVSLLPISGSWRHKLGREAIDKHAIAEYLEQPRDAPLTLFGVKG